MINDLKKSIIEDIVDLQLQAYNEGDYETFASCYHENILSYDLDTAKQIPHLCGIHFFNHYRQKLAENPTLHCEVRQRIVHDNLVVDKEMISNLQSQSHQEMVIYQLEKGLISKMWFSKEIS